MYFFGSGSAIAKSEMKQSNMLLLTSLKFYLATYLHNVKEILCAILVTCFQKHY